ncbi:hypothetical protein VTJ04DRAFT_2703 [Mycothermus thermophilus]|uniref:uncharacterized protein n=1 Tax=Humicola insolens TaxID=85995 RepID=UPI00374376DA
MAPKFLVAAAKMYFKPSGLLFKLAPYFLIIPIIVFQVLSLTGCVGTSPAIPNIYLIKLFDNIHNASADPLQVRIGYFGICGIDETGTRCQSSGGRSVELLASSLFPDIPRPGTVSKNSTAFSASIATTNLITTALDLQSGNFIAMLAAASVLFALGVVSFLVYLRTNWETSPRRAAILRKIAHASLFGAGALSFAGALASMQTAEALEYASVDLPALVLGGDSKAGAAPIRIEAGTTLQVLQWIGFGLQVLFGLAVPFMERGKKKVNVEGWKGEV